MQLNVHVPKERERLLRRLEGAAHRLGKPKNQVVLDAIERYLEEEDEGRGRLPAYAGIPVYHLGDVAPFTRADLYSERGT